MNFKDARMNIEGCRGEKITTGGSLSFEGSPREVYWSFMLPCVQDVIGEALHKADDLGRRYTPSVARKGLDETEELLRVFIGRVYRRMADIDQRLRGSGFPESVSRYDTSGIIAALEAETRARTDSLRRLHRVGFDRVRAQFEENPTALLTFCLSVFATVVALIGLFIHAK